MKITEFLAIYAAVLSSIVFVWNYIRAIPRIKVTMVCGNAEGGRTGTYIVVRNPSAHAVHLRSVTLLYRFKKRRLKDYRDAVRVYKHIPRRLGWVSWDHNFADRDPVSVEPGKAYEVFIPHTEFEQIFRNAVDRKLMAAAQDQLWNNYYSREFNYYENRRRRLDDNNT